MNEDGILKELKEQTKWLRFLALPNLKKTIEETLKTNEQNRIYELSNGKNSSNDISKELSTEGIKVTGMTVRNYWKRWFDLGLVVSSEKHTKRFEKIIDLRDLKKGESSTKRGGNKNG